MVNIRMTTNTDFSVISVVLNDRTHFKRTADSLLRQSGANFEWIVIDGGSTDGTRELCEEYAEHIAVYTSEPDNGIFDAMNKGLAHASGNYVLFLNAGDRLCENALEHVSASLATLSGEESMLFAAALFEYPSGHQYIQRPREIGDYIWHHAPASHQATFFRRDLHQKFLHDPWYRVCADYHSVCSIYVAEPQCGYLDEVVVHCKHGGGSHSHRHPLRLMREAIRTQREVLGIGGGRIAISALRRMVSFTAESLLSYRPLARVAGPVVKRLRPGGIPGRCDLPRKNRRSQ